MAPVNPVARHLQPVRERGPGTGNAPGAVTDLATAEAMARSEIDRARRSLPVLDPAAFDCHLGDLTRALEPTTEADPVAVLASLLCTAGVHLGSDPYIRAGDDRHPLLVWPLIIARTGGGRKGASWGTAKRLLFDAASDFMTDNVRSGLTSGEGLAAMFAEDNDERGESNTWRPPGGRLLVFEPEWAGVMARMKRDGNSLSATLRAAWEGGDLSTLNVKARIARTSHVGILAHITPGEFRAKLQTSDMAGGTYNRFLPLAAARTKFLPVGGGADPALVRDLGAELAARLARAGGLEELRLTPAAADLWYRLYVEFSTDPDQEGVIEQFLSRSAPNCLRIAAIHAVLDHGGPGIGPEHLEPAAALVRYSRATAHAVLSRGNTDAPVVAWIAEAGETGRTRSEITRQFFINASRDGIDPAAVLDRLVTSGLVTVAKRARPGGGRAAEVFTAAPKNLKK